MNKLNRDFDFDFACRLGEEFSNAYNTANGKKPRGFITEVVKSYYEAFEQGASFVGPFAIISDGDQWIVKDLRGGWGYYPLDITISKRPRDKSLPTLSDIKKRLEIQANALKLQSDAYYRLADSINHLNIEQF